MSYSTEFIQFIKTYLVNSVYTEYCKEVYSKGDIESQNFIGDLLDYKNEVYIWDTAFNRVHDLFNYYLHLSVNHMDALNLQNKITYSQNRLSGIYEQVTFQTFIDDQINFQKIGYREYQNFVKSMKDPEFKKKMVNKYNTHIHIRTLKNHIIYVIHLHLAKQTDYATIFTDEEISDMDTMVNMIPYFEHMAKNRWSIQDIESGNIHMDTDSSIKQINFNSLEARVLQRIALFK